MHLPKLKILLIGVLLVLFHLAPAAAVTLTVGSDSGATDATLTIPVTVDDPEGIAGAAFTIVYDPPLTVTVSSDFFDTFYSQFSSPSLTTVGTPNPDGGEYGSSVFPVLDEGVPTGDSITIPAVVDSVDYYQPFITNTVTGGMMISGARCVPAPAGGPTIMFSLDVQLNEGESAGIYSIAVIPTTLNNTDAGYAVGGETIDLLIGSDPTEPVTDPVAFPVILDDSGYAANVVNGSATFSASFVDTDNDGMDDTWETDNFEDLSHDGTEDSDHDGYSDKDEYDNGTDPEVRDEVGLYIGYDACTDSNALRQQVSLDTDALMAYPGGAITVNIDYDVSDSDNTLSGLGIYVHFDSSKVAYTGSENFLNEGDSIQQPNVAVILDDFSDTDNDPDTDKMMLMSWASDSGNWPNQALSVKLCDLNFSVDGSVVSGDMLPFAVSENTTDTNYVFCGTNTEAIVIDVPPVLPPTGVAASDNTFSGMVQVTWNAPEGALSYNVFRADLGSLALAPRTRIATRITETTFDDTSAESGRRYFYWVKVRTAGGFSSLSKYDTGYWGPVGSRPAKPTNVNATDATYADRVRITWDTVPDALIYEIWRSDIPDWLGGIKERVGIVATTSYDDFTVESGSRYCYYVKARNSWGVKKSKLNTGYIGSKSSKPPIPTGVSASDGTISGKVNVTWAAVSGAIIYEIWRATNLVEDGGNPQRVGLLSGTSFDDISAVAGTTYYYWVKTRDSWGASKYSVPDAGYTN